MRNVEKWLQDDPVALPARANATFQGEQACPLDRVGDCACDAGMYVVRGGAGG